MKITKKRIAEVAAAVNKEAQYWGFCIAEYDPSNPPKSIAELQAMVNRHNRWLVDHANDTTHHLERLVSDYHADSLLKASQ